MLSNKMKKLKIFLADDHPLTLAGVKDLLSQDFNLEVVKAVSTSSELVEELKIGIPDIVITDYSMPGDITYGDGIRFIEYLVRNFPNVKVLVLTMVNNPMVISELYAAGVWGVVLKHDKLDEIGKAIHNVRLGNKYYPPGHNKSDHISVKHASLENKIDALSPREFEVIRLFVRGEGVAKIAENLNRSIKTVSTQKRSAMAKLNVKTDQDLIRFFVEHGGAINS